MQLQEDTVWLSQQQIADLFQTSRENITMHLRNVFDEDELDPQATKVRISYWFGKRVSHSSQNGHLLQP